MRYLAAYVLSVLGGKESPTEENIQTILGSVGVDCDSDRVSMVIKQLQGKNIEEIISKGQSLLASVSGASSTPVTTTTQEAVTKPLAIAKEDDKGGDPSDDSDDGEGLLSLFDD
ncbi:hypothetical protein SNE40_004213 [Patella caerulea]|uniref:Large ribosomal subunit protein P2 n=1 Tax=Patella caerulea TaxID=87958 RepID=A0AAN8K9I9_PATCE